MPEQQTVVVSVDRSVQWHRNEFESGGCGHMSHAKSRKKFFVVPRHLLASTSAVSRFGERFRDAQYSLFSFLFAVILLTAMPPCAQPFAKVGGTCPRAICSRRHWTSVVEEWSAFLMVER